MTFSKMQQSARESCLHFLDAASATPSVQKVKPTKDVFKGQIGVEGATYVQVEKHAGVNCGRLGPLDGGLYVGQDSGIGHKPGKVASDGSDGTRPGCHPCCAS